MRKDHFLFLYYCISSLNICCWPLCDKPQGRRDLYPDPMSLGLEACSRGQGPRQDAVQEAGMEIPSGPSGDTPRAATEGEQMSTRLLPFGKHPTAIVTF